MYDEVIEISGRSAGPTSIILGGVHGDEVCGTEAVQKAIQELRIDRGRVLLGFGNPRAIVANKRFTESNLNRMFKPAELLSAADKASYEYERAEYLKTYLDQAETLLDIHASYTPESRRFVICEPNAADIVKYLPVDLVVSGFDQVEPGGTDYYMNSRGKIGICIECGYLGDPASVQVAERGIDAFLRAAGHLGNDLSETPQSYIRMNEIYLTTSNDFKLSRPFADFDSVSEGEVVGLDSGREVRAEEEGIILFARNCQKAGEEAFLLGEKKSGLA